MPPKPNSYVAFLRGINVAGRNILPMKSLIQLFVESGCSQVRSYIQSGNVLFTAPSATAKQLPRSIPERIKQQFGYRIPVVIRTEEELRSVLTANPFLQAGVPERALHVYFLADRPNPKSLSTLDPNRSAPDTFHPHSGEIYLNLPKGMGRTKLTNAYFDSKLSTVSTARNWATVTKICQLLNS